MVRVVTDPSRDPLPDRLQDLVPEELEDAVLFGLESADIEDSVLLYGPPGAGKTTTAGFRVALLAEDEELSPRDVTVVTFRRSQASVLEDRLVNEWGVFPDAKEDLEDPFKFWTTSHALACRSTDFHDRFEAAREEGNRVAGMVTGDDPDPALRFCRDVGIQCYPRTPGAETRWTAFRSLYTYCKNNLLAVGQWDLPDSMLRGVETSEDENDAEICKRVLASDPRAFRLLMDFYAEWGNNASFHAVVETWESWKDEHCVADFYEQLVAGITGPLPPTRLVVIDELHDATPLMACYFERLINAADTAVVAGDPDQCINAFSGSDRRIFTGLPDRVDIDLPVVQLPESYRCTDESLAAATRVLEQHHSPPDLSSDGAGKIWRHETDHTFENDDDGVWSLPDRGTPRSPFALWQTFGSDIMFLARTQMMVDAPAADLDRHGVIYQSQEDVGGDWEARCTLLKMLERFVEFHPEHGRDPSEAEKSGVDYSDVLKFVDHVPSKYLDGESYPRRDVKREIRSARRADEEFTIADFNDLVENGFWQAFGRGIQSITEFVQINDRNGFSKSRKRDVVAMKQAWERYVQEQERSFSAGVKALSQGTKLWTIHASKGDESEHCVVYAGVTRKVKRSIEEYQEEAANEARTWYVALTRTKNGLHIVRDAFDMTVPTRAGPSNDRDEYLPDDLEIMAAREASEYRENTESGASGAVTGGD